MSLKIAVRNLDYVDFKSAKEGEEKGKQRYSS